MKRLDRERSALRDKVKAGKLIPEEQVKACTLLLRNKSWPELMEGLQSLVRELPQPSDSQPTAILITEIKTHCELLSIKRLQFIEQTRDAIESLAQKIPNNRFNLREALSGFATTLDAERPDSILHALWCATNELNPEIEHSSATFSSQDLKDEYSRGFEAGYQRALENKHRCDDELEMDQLDLE